MKIVLLCSSQPNQIALANKIAIEYNLAGIVVENKVKKHSLYSLLNLFNSFTDQFLLPKIRRSWLQMLHYYHTKYEQFPSSNIFYTKNINDTTVKDFLLDIKPDLIMVSGTSIIKENILKIPFPAGIINLHTGLSPYIKGGPNCTNWCVANRQFHLIGNSTMWINSGIDSGDLISTEIVQFTGNESLFEIHLKVMEHAHKLYLQSVEKIINKTAIRVKQNSIAKGKIYYTKNWNLKEKRKLIANLKYFHVDINSVNYNKKLKSTIVVD
jgi:methionyl-tRNA formyltransferase